VDSAGIACVGGVCVVFRCVGDQGCPQRPAFLMYGDLNWFCFFFRCRFQYFVCLGDRCGVTHATDTCRFRRSAAARSALLSPPPPTTTSARQVLTAPAVSFATFPFSVCPSARVLSENPRSLLWLHINDFGCRYGGLTIYFFCCICFRSVLGRLQ